MNLKKTLKNAIYGSALLVLSVAGLSIGKPNSLESRISYKDNQHEVVDIEKIAKEKEEFSKQYWENLPRENEGHKITEEQGKKLDEIAIKWVNDILPMSIRTGIIEKSAIYGKIASYSDNYENERMQDVMHLVTSQYVGDVLIKRFNEFDELFFKYSAEHPKKFNREEFKALLVAIAEQESSLGYPNGKKRAPSLIMGYDNWKRYGDKFLGEENQIRAASKTLREAFDGENPNYKLNQNARNMTNILSIYYQGRINKEGIDYANSVIERYAKWKKEFSKE
ncbi:MAG: hypothetical protein Q7S56_00780 [Nanoarchaeota archaeon]|nr:hypothetical protein [Nanoarchaeota archaeon]